MRILLFLSFLLCSIVCLQVNNIIRILSEIAVDMRQALIHFSMGIPYSFFTMVDLNYGWMLQSYGLVRMNGAGKAVYKRPKFYAVQHIASLFTPEFKATDAVGLSCNTSEKVYSFGLEKNGRPVGCVLWLCGNRPSDTLERRLADISVQGVTMKDPVYVDMLTGYVHDLKGILDKYYAREYDTVILKDFPIWDSPVVIIDRSELPNLTNFSRHE